MTQPNPATPPTPLLEISTGRAIALVRRWRWLSIVLRVGLLCLLAGAVVAYERGGGFLVVLGMFVLWTIVASLSARARKLALDAGQHFAAGELDLAEDRLTQSLTSFTLAGSTKQLGLQQLALLRHAQSRWAEAAALAQAYLAGRRRADARVDVSSRLVLAESLLELGEVDAVGNELAQFAHLRLNLRETLTLTQVRLDYLSRKGEFATMFINPHDTVGLVELMPASVAARCHAMMALAAKRLGKADWYAWLVERATLLGDVRSVIEARPHLRDSFEILPPSAG